MNLKTILLIACSCFILAGCNESQIAGSIGAGASLVKGLTVSKNELVKSARLSAKEMDKEAKIAPPNSKYTKRLNRLTKNVQQYDGVKLNYKVYLTKDINAFAMPDGTVRIYSGLMDKMNDDELMAVIGHEIGHVSLEHSLSQYKKQYMTNAAKLGLGAVGGETGALAGAFGDLGAAFVNAQFSQSDELEADAYSVHFLKNIGRDPYAAVNAQKKLQQLSDGGLAISLFSSHPPSATRIKKAKEEADKVSGK